MKDDEGRGCDLRALLDGFDEVSIRFIVTVLHCCGLSTWARPERYARTRTKKFKLSHFYRASNATTDAPSVSAEPRPR